MFRSHRITWSDCFEAIPVVRMESYSFSVLLFEQFNVWCVVVNQKVSFLWRCWCESYQSFIDYILSRKLFTNLYSKHRFLWAIVYRECGNWRLLVLVEHRFFFYVCSAVNFEEFPTDPKDVKDKDNQAGHPKDLAQTEKRRGGQNTGWSKQQNRVAKYHGYDRYNVKLM